MSTDEANDFVPEHLAKWRKITHEYLLAPIELLGASSGPGAGSLCCFQLSTFPKKRERYEIRPE